MPNFKKIAFFLVMLYACLFAEYRIGEITRSSSNTEVLKEMHGEAFISSFTISLNRAERSSFIEIYDTLAIPLGGNKSIKLRKVKSRVLSKGGIYWRGDILGAESGYADILVRNNLISGSIYLGDIVYKIDALSENSIRIVTLDPDARPENIDDCNINTNMESKEESINLKVRDKSRAYIYVDVLILYPQTVENMMGGETAMENEILFRIEEANEAFENSLMDTRFRLAHHQVISTSEIPAAATSASDVSGSSLAVSLRKQYKADLVSHWNYGGSAGSGNNFSGSYSSAYNTSNISDVQSRYTFVHECGHNMGAKHDRYTYIIQGREDELADNLYKYGHFMDYGSNTARTIMSYDQCSYVGIGGSCTRVPYFSNPNVDYNGAVTGINPPNSKAAYNARRIDECTPTVSAFEDGDPVVTYKLTVVSGSGSGEYETGAIVTISANDPASGKLFDKWAGDVSGVSNVNSQTTTITIGSEDVTVTASYKDEIINIDTSDASPDLLTIGTWEVDHDGYGNSSVDTGSALINNGVVKADFTIGVSDEPNEKWTYGSLTAYLDENTDLSEMNYIKITYNSSESLTVSLPQPPLSDSGLSYMYKLPPVNSDTTVLLSISLFNQPDWIKDAQKADLDLTKVKSISFETNVDGAGQDIEISKVILYGYDLPVSNIYLKNRISKKISIGGIIDGFMNISIPVSGEYKLSVYTIDGKLINELVKKDFKKGAHKINCNDLFISSGLYFIKLEGMGNTFVRKLILNSKK